ncbi:aryl-alcohol dehydrogenase [Rhizoctonia solani AG-1 IA]|uniref:Aryl-alcohol dehydrogenase n=1 Tax=Thanatephorus cucumeris (strain AG1-IA) TaxID=983506 RepID=L8WRE3_THACA|nr:aryl-alcohol dehydrogenase [Rhizoctonia solani AG-1 IA]
MKTRHSEEFCIHQAGHLTRPCAQHLFSYFLYTSHSFVPVFSAILCSSLSLPSLVYLGLHPNCSRIASHTHIPCIAPTTHLLYLPQGFRSSHFVRLSISRVQALNCTFHFPSISLFFFAGSPDGPRQLTSTLQPFGRLSISALRPPLLHSSLMAIAMFDVPITHEISTLPHPSYGMSLTSSLARLGSSGLKVSRIILGTMSYGTPDWQGWVLNEEEGLKHIKAAYDAGIQTFDTANVYSNGLSEMIVGKAIKKYNLPRDEIVILTKVMLPVGKEHNLSSEALFVGDAELEAKGYTNQFGLSRKVGHIFDSVKRSLERLQLDYVDVLQCHRFDYNTPIAETMQALHDVVQAGYARYIGMSSCYAYQFHAMQNYAITNKLTPFISMQNYYNLIYREEEREMIPTLKDGQMDGPREEADGVRECDNQAELAESKGVSMAQISVAWALSKDPVAAPIVGTTSLKNLEDIIGQLDQRDGKWYESADALALGAINVKLTEEEIKSLEEPYLSQSISGHY